MFSVVNDMSCWQFVCVNTGAINRCSIAWTDGYKVLISVDVLVVCASKS